MTQYNESKDSVAELKEQIKNIYTKNEIYVKNETYSKSETNSRGTLYFYGIK